VIYSRAPSSKPLERSAAMPEDKQGSTMIRVPADFYSRLELLRRRMVRLGAPELAAAPRESIAAVFRVALSLGVTALERRYPRVTRETVAKGKRVKLKRVTSED
jgi:hypothetical protein